MRKLVIITLIAASIIVPFTTSAAVLSGAFGGKIISSVPRVCLFPAGIFPIPVPLQAIKIGPPANMTVVYIYYTFILQLFGIHNSLYLYEQFYRPGPNVLGTFVRAPIPWINCSDLIPSNVILKIGTSLL